MHYVKIQNVAIFTNSSKNLVLRQRFAMEFLRLAQNKKHFLNVDESWLGQSDYRRLKWQVKGRPATLQPHQLQPRISVILGIDSEGQLYLSLVQANSNSDIMAAFFRQLALKLDRERPGWRNDTVIVLDNAPYHTSAATLKVLESLQMPVLFTGPHSFSGVPVELVFSMLKRTNLNPRLVPTGKK